MLCDFSYPPAQPVFRCFPHLYQHMHRQLFNLKNSSQKEEPKYTEIQTFSIRKAAAENRLTMKVCHIIAETPERRA